MAKSQNLQYFQSYFEGKVWLHVAVREYKMGRFLEIRVPNYEACNEIFLKVPGDNKKGKEWAYFANKLKHFVLDGVKEGALKIATMQGSEKVEGGKWSNIKMKVRVHEQGVFVNTGAEESNASMES